MSRIAALAVVASAVPALAQTSVFSVADRSAWGENIGWTNWRPAGTPAGATPMIQGGSFLSGRVWSENVGWLSLGDGTPGLGSAYANATGADFGVNVTPGGMLEGMAWGENIGWVNFGPHAGLPAAQRARLDTAARRLRGYAWGENVGWINLNDAERFVALACRADLTTTAVAGSSGYGTPNGVLNSEDFFYFLAQYAGGNLGVCDLTSTAVAGSMGYGVPNGVLNSEDFFYYLALYAGGC